MQNNPDFSDVNVSERPEDTIKEGTVQNVIKGQRGELYDVDPENLKYGSIDDELVQIEVLVQHRGHEFTVYEDMTFYESPSDRSMFGSYINKYGAPVQGQEVKVDFDEEGNAQIRGIRQN